MAQYQPDCLTEIERQPQQPGVRWQREESVMGFTEGQVTAEVARRWNFPDAVVRALDSSANPTEYRPFSRLGAVLHLGELLSETENVDASTVATLPAEVLEALMLDKTWLEEHLPAARVQVEELAVH
jgi:HD-like signal output (HDOD) protein